jgi:spore maturation protein CgeB
MKILVYEFKGWPMIDYINSLVLLGYKVNTILNSTEEVYEYDEEFYTRMQRNIDSFKPNIVFSLNYFPYVSALCEKNNVKYISWAFDNPLLYLYSETAKNKCNYLFMFDKSQYEEFKSYGFEHVYYLPLSANVERLDKIKLTDADMRKYSSEVSFVGKLYDDNPYNKIKKVPGYMKGYVDALVEAQLNIISYNFIEDSLTDEFVDIFKQTTDYTIGESNNIAYRKLIAQKYINRKCTEIERKRTFGNVSEYCNLTIFGNNDLSSLPKALKKPEVDYLLDMPKVFKLSKINLNVTLKSIIHGIPMRVFDIMGAGGFVITNYQSGIEDWFEIGKELAVYYDLDDLKEKILYYLENEEERRNIAFNGYMKVCKEHSMKKKLAYMIDTVVKSNEMI